MDGLKEIQAYQIYFKEEQKPFISNSCLPFYNKSEKEDFFLEYGVILDSYLKDFHKSSKYSGVFSWRFKNKTGIDPETFFQFIKDNPGYEVYFINPFPEQAILYNNIWRQGEISHPGLFKLATELFSKLGYDINLEEVVSTPMNSLYSNYWVASESFWNKYIEFTKPIYDFIVSNPDDDTVSSVKKTAIYHYNVSFIPFIMERMFSTLLWKDRSIKYKPYIFSEKQIAELINKFRYYESVYQKNQEEIIIQKDYIILEKERVIDEFEKIIQEKEKVILKLLNSISYNLGFLLIHPFNRNGWKNLFNVLKAHLTQGGNMRKK